MELTLANLANMYPAKIAVGARIYGCLGNVTAYAYVIKDGHNIKNYNPTNINGTFLNCYRRTDAPLCFLFLIVLVFKHPVALIYHFFTYMHYVGEHTHILKRKFLQCAPANLETSCLLESVTFLGNCGCVAFANFFCMPSPLQFPDL
jgi:hypothetical protein